MRKQPRRRSSLWRNIMTRIVVLVMLPVLLGSVFFIYKNQSDAAEALTNSHLQIADQAAISIGAYMDQIQQTAITFNSDSILTVFLSRRYDAREDYSTYSRTVSTRLKYGIDALNGAEVLIFMTNGTIPNGFDIFYNDRYLWDYPHLEDFLNDPNADDAWLYIPAEMRYPAYHPLSQTHDSLLYIKKMSPYNGAPLGYITAMVPVRNLVEKSGMSAASAYDAENHTLSIYYTERAPDVQLSPDELANGATGISGETQYSVRALREVPVSLIIFTSRYENILNYLAIPIVILLTITLLVMLFARHINGLIGSIQSLIDETRNTLQGDLQYRLSPANDPDVNVIIDSINVLLDRLSELVARMILQQNAMKEAQLLALQHQINPHFIYNTVELLAGRMELEGMYEESDALTNFAGLFRYNLNVNENDTTIADEISNVRQYLSIQRLSRPNLHLVTDIDPALTALSLPRFTFQPLIENSILHGQAQPGQPLTLSISAHREGGIARIRVEDDGIGMSVERLEQLNELLASEAEDRAKRSIGIFNIHLRLTLLHGTGLTIESHEGQGTRIFFDVPLPD